MHTAPDHRQPTNIGLGNSLASIRRYLIIWSSDGIVYWRIYASHGVDVLLHFQYELVLYYYIRYAAEYHLG